MKNLNKVIKSIKEKETDLIIKYLDKDFINLYNHNDVSNSVVEEYLENEYILEAINTIIMNSENKFEENEALCIHICKKDTGVYKIYINDVDETVYITSDGDIDYQDWK